MAGARDYSHWLKIFALFLIIIILTLLHLLFLPLHNCPFAFVEGVEGRLQSDIVYQISIFSLFKNISGLYLYFMWGSSSVNIYI